MITRNKYLRKALVNSLLSASLASGLNSIALAREDNVTNNQTTAKEKNKVSEVVTEDYFNQIDRMFNNLYRMNVWSDIFANYPNRMNSSYTQVNLNANDKEYILNMDYPGFEKDELKVEVKDNYLVITGAKATKTKDEKDDSKYSQEYRGSFQHRFSIPEDADTDKISSSLKNGVLTMIIPRVTVKKVQTKQIMIK